MAFEKTGKTGRNNHSNYDYSKIEDIYNAVVPPLADNGIVVWHFAYPFEGQLLLETRLVHTSGQWISDKRFLHSEKPGNQAAGAANTYMRKYAVLSLCGIATEDDDGAAEEKYIETNKPVIVLMQSEIMQLDANLKQAANGELLRKGILDHYKKSDICLLTKQQYLEALEIIKRKATY